MLKRMTILIVLITAVMLVIGACTAAVPPVLVTSNGEAVESAQVYFLEPTNGATVNSPVTVTMSGEFFTVEPAGDIRPGAGHLHILVDTACVEPGAVIAKDETHLHYGGGQLTAELNLAPGEHTLCLQAADGAHTALPGEGMTDVITVVVE